MNLLDVLEEFVIIRKGMRRCGQGGGGQAFLGTRGYGGDLVIVGLSIGDLEIAEAQRGQQVGILQAEWIPAAERTVHPIPCEIRFGVSVPMQNDALVACPAHHARRGVDAEGDLERCRQEKNLKKQTSVHIRAADLKPTYHRTGRERNLQTRAAVPPSAS